MRLSVFILRNQGIVLWSFKLFILVAVSMVGLPCLFSVDPFLRGREH